MRDADQGQERDPRLNDWRLIETDRFRRFGVIAAQFASRLFVQKVNR